MIINLDYPHLLELFPQHRASLRSESASFLIWYLENYYRLDALEATDAVCDQPNDKGADGVFVNDNDKTITIFQSRISQKSNATIGDKSLREFAGTLTQFETPAGIQNVIDTANVQLAALARKLDLINRISTHELRGEFLCNIDKDANGENFLKTKTSPHITFVGKTALTDTYISDKRDLPVHQTVSFDIIGFNVAEYTVDVKTKAIIAPIRATELVTMEGISNQSLFAYNVRGPLGKTGVNKEIRDSIKDRNLHKLFPLFHNGITVIAKTIETTSDSIAISDYFVVNGCQSLTAFYNGSKELTDNLRVLTKFIQLEPDTSLAKTITEYSNNQNGVKDRDFMANDAKQIRLQNEFKITYPGVYSFEIKRGEVKDSGKLISNEDAGLLLMAFDLKEPWATHRTYQIFEDKYSNIFGRKEVTADRIVMCQVISEAISLVLPKIKNQLVGKYKLTRFVLVYIVRNILDQDDLSQEILTRPELFVRDENNRNKFRSCIERIIGDLVVDLNAEIDEYGPDFAYRDKLRDLEWVKQFSKMVVTDHAKLVKRGRFQSFCAEWKQGT